MVQLKYKYAKILSENTGRLVWLGPVLLWFWWQLWGWFWCWLQCTEVFKMMHKAIIWWRNQIGLQFILMEFVKSKCYATSNNLIIFRPKLVLVLWFFFWLCKYFESDLAKVIQSQTICQPAITTFPLGLYWKTYLYLFLSKKIAPKWKVIQVSKISLLSKVRDKGGGRFSKR